MGIRYSDFLYSGQKCAAISEELQKLFKHFWAGINDMTHEISAEFYLAVCNFMESEIYTYTSRVFF